MTEKTSNKKGRPRGHLSSNAFAERALSIIETAGLAAKTQASESHLNETICKLNRHNARAAPFSEPLPWLTRNANHRTRCATELHQKVISFRFLCPGYVRDNGPKKLQPKAEMCRQLCPARGCLCDATRGPTVRGSINVERHATWVCISPNPSRTLQKATRAPSEPERISKSIQVGT